LGGNVCGWSGAREDKEFAGRDVVEGGDGEVKILAEDGFRVMREDLGSEEGVVFGERAVIEDEEELDADV
jgi:hypothetical protein